MSDYIKKEDAVNTIRNAFTGMTADTLELRINDIPSADVAPVRHGRWIDEEPTVIKCSACGEEFNDEIVYMTYPYNNLRYCPGCGAKMDLED